MEKTEPLFILLIFFVCVISIVPGLTLQTFGNPNITPTTSLLGFERSDAASTLFTIWCFKQGIINSQNPYNCSYIPLNPDFSLNWVSSHMTPWLANLMGFSDNLIFSINMTFLFSIFLSGIFMYLYVRTLSKNNIIALIAGIAFSISNYTAYQVFYTHLDYMHIFGFPMIMYCIEKYTKNFNRKFLLLTSFSCLILIISELHTAYISLIFAAAYSVLKLKKRSLNIALATAFGVFLSLPFQLHSIAVLTGGKFWLRTFEEQLFYPLYDLLFNKRGLGFFLLSILPISLLHKNKYKSFFLFSLVFSILLASNPLLYSLIYSFVPLFKYFRLPFRFFLITVFSASVLCAFSIDYLTRKFKRYNTVIVVLSILFLVGQFQLADLSFWTFKNITFFDGWYDSNLSILEYPTFDIDDGPGVNYSFKKSEVYNYFISIHKNKLMNSFSEYPTEESELLLKDSDLFYSNPTEETFESICGWGVNAVVCHNCTKEIILFLNNSGTLVNYDKELVVAKVQNSKMTLNMTLGESYFFVDLC